MSIKSIKDFWAGAIYIAFGTSAVVLARNYGMGTAFKMGPAYFPTILGSLLVLIGLISLSRSFFVPGTPIGSVALKGLALVVGATVVFGALVRGAGLVVAVPVFVIFSACASIHFRWAPTVGLAAGLTVFCVLVFLKGLGVPLPVIGPWLGGQ
jgi:putative tricarboxylic transport membrane protein